jgi:tetratricopeptide (TPR) repeat protein
MTESDDVLEKNVEALMKAGPVKADGESTKMPEGSRTRVREKLLADLRARRGGRLPWRWRRSALGGAVVAIAAAAALYLRPAEAPEGRRHTNSGTRPMVVQLADGTRATLDAGAALVERGAGDVTLERGRAVFDVGAREFVVATPAGLVASTGGRFLAELDGEGAALTVARGVVSLGAPGDVRRAHAHAGNAVRLRQGAPPLVERSQRVSHVLAFAEDAEPELGAPPRERAGNLVAREPVTRVAAPIQSRRFDLDVIVEDGFARATIDQTYFNPTERQLEGVYSFQTPHGASISRLAMYVDGTLMEGAVVDRSRGRDIYEGIVEQRRDPALLEWMGADDFRMRIFPLPARSEKRVFLSFTELLERTYDSSRLVVPIPALDGPTREARFTVRIRGGASLPVASSSHDLVESVEGEDKLLTWEAHEELLGRDLALQIGDERGRAGTVTFDDGATQLALVRATPSLRDAAKPRERAPRQFVVWFDVSASRARSEIFAQLRWVKGLERSIDPDDSLEVFAVGHEVVRWTRQRPLEEFIDERSLFGGDSRVDLAARALEELATPEGHETAVVYVGDGAFTTLGATIDRDELARRLRGRAARFYGVGVGSDVDRGALLDLAAKTGGFGLTLGEDEPARRRAFEFVSRLASPCVTKLAIERVDGVKALTDAGAFCDGDEIRALLGSEAGLPTTVRFTGELDGAPWSMSVPVDGKGGRAPYLPRLHAEWTIRELSREHPIPAGASEASSPTEGAVREQITKLGTKHFLVTPFTSLLVLEDDAMYETYGVERGTPRGPFEYAAPAKIPVVYEPVRGSAPLAMSQAFEVLDRSQRSLFSVSVQESRSWEHGLGSIGAIGFGGMGLSGIGEGGGGRGQGFGGGMWGGRLGGDVRMGGSGRLGGSHRSTVERRWSSSERVDTRTLTLGLAAREPDVSARRWRRDRNTDFVERLGVETGEDASWLRLAMLGVRTVGLENANDERFSDVTALARGLFAIPEDRLDAAPVDVPHDVSQPSTARPVLDVLREARAARKRSERWVGKTVELTMGDGGFERRMLLSTGLREVTSWREGELLHTYPELGLRTRRRLGASRVLVSSLEGVPWIPTEESLRGCELSLAAPEPSGAATSVAGGVTTVRARCSSASHDDRWPAAIDWVFDSERRLVGVVHHGGEGFVDLRLVWSGTSVTVTRGGIVQTFVVSEAEADEPPGEVDVTLELPLRNPVAALAEARRATDVATKRALLRHALAADAALRDADAMEELLGELARLGPLTTGDAVLGSLFLSSSGGRALRKLLPAGQPASAYLRAFEGGTSMHFDEAAALARSGVWATLAELRAGLLLEPSVARAKRRVRTFTAAHPDHPLLGLLLARHASRDLESSRLLGFWRSLADDSDLGMVASRELAASLSWNDDTTEARRLLGRAFTRALERGLPISWDWDLSQAVGYGVEADLFFAPLRSYLLSRGSSAQVLEWTRMEVRARSDRRVEGSAMVRRLEAIASPSEREVGARALVAAQDYESARRLLAPVLASELGSVEAWTTGSQIYEAFGDLDRAIELRQRSLERTRGSARSIEEVRAWCRALLELEGRRLALDPSHPEKERAFFEALSRFIAEAPEDTTVPELAAVTLFRAGRGDLADSVLASLVDRAPAEGRSWGVVGAAWFSQGRLDEADSALDRAVSVEPTNPRWRLRRAEVALARGTDEGRSAGQADLDFVADGKWQDRFADQVQAALRLRTAVRKQ